MNDWAGGYTGAFVTLDDRTGRLELAVFSELFERHRDLLAKDALLVVKGHVSVDEYTGGFKMSAEEIYNIEQARGAFGSRLVIAVDAAHRIDRRPTRAAHGRSRKRELRAVREPGPRAR